MGMMGIMETCAVIGHIGGNDAIVWTVDCVVCERHDSHILYYTELAMRLQQKFERIRTKFWR